jgi:hypothetical protein
MSSFTDILLHSTVDRVLKNHVDKSRVTLFLDVCDIPQEPLKGMLLKKLESLHLPSF